MARVTVLGLGAMGSRMAANLLKAGHAVTVWNRSPAAAEALVAAGAQLADTPREAAKGADFVIAMVRDDAASRAIWLGAESGALAGMARGAVAIESSTLTVGHMRLLAEHCSNLNIGFLDAPVAGSRPQAEAAQLIYLVGGDAPVFQAAEPILRSMGGAVHHAGKAGDGAALKLAINALFGIQVAAMAELLGLLRKSGVDAARAVEIIAATPVCSPAAKAAAGAMLSSNFAPMFPVDLVEKDFGYAMDLGVAAVAQLPLTDSVRGVFQTAAKHGFGADNLTGVIRLYG
jgi:3-hydroxyisobutyrate dehydrogenase